MAPGVPGPLLLDGQAECALVTIVACITSLNDLLDHLPSKVTSELDMPVTTVDRVIHCLSSLSGLIAM